MRLILTCTTVFVVVAVAAANHIKTGNFFGFERSENRRIADHFTLKFSIQGHVIYAHYLYQKMEILGGVIAQFKMVYSLNTVQNAELFALMDMIFGKVSNKSFRSTKVHQNSNELK